jgi:cytochrome c oxidase assembly protein subunit 15
VSTRFRISPAVFRWFALADFVAMILIVLTGAAVRLTGSGLGCPDWPQCYHHAPAHAWGLHPLIEFSNRLVSGTFGVLTILVIVAALRRTPRRRDLTALAASLCAGVVVDALLGEAVVYSKLNPWLVSVHMLVSLAMVVVAANLYHRSKYLYGPGARAEIRDPRRKPLAPLLASLFSLVLVVGSATTGSGPHAGNSQGQDIARRLPFALVNVAWAHSALATVFIGTVAMLFFIMWREQAPQKSFRGVRRLLIIGMLQGVVGFVQFAVHLPAVLVELHVALATSLTIGLTQFWLAQTGRDREPGLGGPS